MAVKKTTKKTKRVEVSESKVDYSSQISALREDMRLASTDSVAISILALLLFIGAPSVFPTIIDPYNPNSLKIMQWIIIVPSAYWVFTILSNLYRMFRVYRLSKKTS